MLKIKIKCLSSWDTDAGSPLMIRLLSQVPRLCLLTCWSTCWSVLCFFFETCRNVTLTCLMFFVLTRYKSVAENPASLKQFRRAIWEAGFWASPQLGSNKRHFYSYYWVFTDYFRRQDGVWDWRPEACDNLGR